jgi:hypothetical protein
MRYRKRKAYMISEKDMENSIISNPEKYLGETGLKLLAQQHRIGNYIFDILFEDRHGAKMIVELQKGTLDRVHTYKILDYYHEYKENNPLEFIELMVIANKIPDERKKRLSNWGVSFKEIPGEDFAELKNMIEKDVNEPSTYSLQCQSEVNKSTAQQDNNAIDKLCSSLPIFKSNFQSAYDKCDSKIRDIFLVLVNKFVTYPIRQYTVDKPDYRFTKKFVFCAFVLQLKTLLIELRVDNYHLSSSLLTVNLIKDATRPGKRWLAFRVNNENQIEEAYRLIDEVYKFSP